jgi:peptidoglycan/xylan/chitin deacetylase (PgdA/CDA1 family)
MRAGASSRLMYLVKTPSLLKPLSKDLLWHVSTSEQTVYFTFDDGPTPGVTESALELLKHYDAQATFFCLGKNVEAHPTLFHRIMQEGHAVANHTYDHPDGWKTNQVAYLRNVIMAQKTIRSNLFRPPYGRITPAQVSALKSRYRIVMWDVLSADFDAANTPQQCFENVVKNVTPGSIVVFHDSIKAQENMLYALEQSLLHLSREGYIFRALSDT